jgi:menaquinone-dependent protoporphyrinogen oxidase
MTEIAIVYTTREGHTEKVANHIAEQFRACPGTAVHVFTTDEAPRSLAGFDAVVVGGSIHFGHHEGDLLSFAKRHRNELAARPSAYFSVSGSAGSEDDQYASQATGYASEFIDKTDWTPDVMGIFAGAIKYTQYGFIKRRIMRHIASKEGEPTDTSRDHELTDWADVDAFAADVLTHLAPAPAEAAG